MKPTTDTWQPQLIVIIINNSKQQLWVLHTCLLLKYNYYSPVRKTKSFMYYRRWYSSKTYSQPGDLYIGALETRLFKITDYLAIGSNKRFIWNLKIVLNLRSISQTNDWIKLCNYLTYLEYIFLRISTIVMY